MITPTTTYPYGERRLNLRLLRYWQEKRKTNRMPRESDIDPEILGADWEFCFVLQARDIANTSDYNFLYLGDKILKAYFDDDVDQHNEFSAGPNAFQLSKHFAKVVESKSPVLDEGQFQTLHGRKVLYRQVLLPLGTPHGKVEAIFGGMNYKIVE